MLQILAAAALGVGIGAAMGYLNLSLQRVYFAIANLSLAVVVETLVHNILSGRRAGVC